jgi:hypothetical protein
MPTTAINTRQKYSDLFSFWGLGVTHRRHDSEQGHQKEDDVEALRKLVEQQRPAEHRRAGAIADGRS